MLFYMRRTMKVLLTLLIFIPICEIFNISALDTMMEQFPTIILTVAFLDVSDEMYSRCVRLFNWLVNKITSSKISRRWDLEERINDIKSRYWIPIVITLVIIYFLGRWVLFK